MEARLRDGAVWDLRRGDEVLAELVVTVPDFPWLGGVLAPAAGFADVRPLFEEELRLSRLTEDDGAWIEVWEQHLERLWSAVRLVDPDGVEVHDWVLHVDGTEAEWRWVDDGEPDAGHAG